MLGLGGSRSIKTHEIGIAAGVDLLPVGFLGAISKTSAELLEVPLYGSN